MRKLLALVFAVMMMASLCMPALSAEIEVDKFYVNETTEFAYTISGGEVTITGIMDTLPATLDIPETIEGYPVTTIKDGVFKYKTEIEVVNMPSIIYIGADSFVYCSELTTVNMPNAKEIGAGAFSSCDKLGNITAGSICSLGNFAFASSNNIKDFTFPATLTTIGYNPFSRCLNLIEFKVDEGNPSFAVGANGKMLCSKDMKTLFSYPSASRSVELPDSITEVGAYAFASSQFYCSPYVTNALSSISMPSVTKVGTFAFSLCCDLVSVSAPKLSDIGPSAFYRCVNLPVAPLGCAEIIGDYAFEDCEKLATAVIPACTRTIGKVPFRYCPLLSNFDVSDENPYFCDRDGVVFTKDLSTVITTAIVNGKKIVLPQETQTVAAAAFAYCGVEGVIMPNVTVLEECAFEDSCIETIYMPKVETIGASCFTSCNDLTSVELISTKSVGEEAFKMCTKLTEVELYNIQSIGRRAFGSCLSLVGAYFHNAAPTDVSSSVFDQSSNDFTIYYLNPDEVWETAVWSSYNRETFTPIDITFKDSIEQKTIAEYESHVDKIVVNFPQAPEHEGYTFTAWDYDGTAIAEDITISAGYSMNTYTVLFVDGVTNLKIENRTVDHGTIITDFPTAPEHDGYVFKGWSYDGTPIKTDISIIAQYEKIMYTVTFVDSVTNETISQLAVESNTVLKEENFPTAPEHDGYIFTAWDYDGSPITGDITIKALYTVTSGNIGDINDDGDINTGDAVMILRISAGILTASSEQEHTGDVNKDGVLNTGDAVVLLRYAAGMIDHFE